ncbi:unnamed protein product [Mucor hiemalis]
MIKKKLPYNLEALTWDNDHNWNIENTYCYCGEGLNDDQPAIRCEKCRQWFHGDCISCMVKPLILGDTFGTFHCSVCNQGEETFQRKGLSWIAIVHLVIYHLIRKAQIEDAQKSPKSRRDHYYFRWKEDVCAFIDDYWDYLVPDKQRSLTWNNTIASVLSTHSNLFLSGFEKFHQSAWWTLHKVEPPSNEKKSKATTKGKPNLKKPLKRSRRASDADPVKQKKPKKVVKKEITPDPDMLDLSSLSELSSADDLSGDESKPTATTRKKKEPVKKKQVVKDPVEDSTIMKKPAAQKPEKEAKKKSPSPQVPSSPTPPLPKPFTQITSKPIEPPLQLKTSISSTLLNQAITKPIHQQSLSPLNSPKIEEIQKPTIWDTVKKPQTTANNSTSVNNHHLSQQDEWSLLQRLEHSSKKLSHSACRYKRKLAVRRLKRNLGIKLFDMDTQLVHMLRMQKHNLEPISKTTTIQPALNQQEEQTNDDKQQLLDKITSTPYTSSFASRLFGSIRQRETITREEPWLSSWNGRKLRPFIRRDYQSKPKRMLMMGQIKACQGKPFKKGEERSGVIPGESIDYVYFQKEHLVQVNELLSRTFWEGVDVSESLLFPEFSIVALYKRHVIGCAFMTPEAYITYFAVEPGWGNASVGQ